MSVTMKTVNFVERSELFDNCEDAFAAFSDNPNCSWGDNDRTLIYASYIASILNGCDPDDYDNPENFKEQRETVRQRITEVKATYSCDDFYVDLEN